MTPSGRERGPQLVLAGSVALLVAILAIAGADAFTLDIADGFAPSYRPRSSR
jgi:hypothetical protein